LAEPAVDIQRVRKAFAGHVAIENLSLVVPRGSVYGLLGPNGAGKTTTIRMILDIMEPDAGTIRIFGESSLQGRISNRIGYLPEERGLYRKMQVRRVLRFLAELKGVRAPEANRRIDRWLARLALTGNGCDWGAARVDELSRGMQQKVQFIGALLHEPELIILDEPFSGLDPVNAQALQDIVMELKRQGRTVIFSTHRMENAERLCDAVCIIAHGVMVLDGTVAAVKAERGGRHVALVLGGDRLPAVNAVLGDPLLVRRLDDSNHAVELELAVDASPQLLLHRLIDAGAAVERFELVQPSLHRIFLDAAGGDA
jgi:ABC-2 type transport system ATP-binding protein